MNRNMIKYIFSNLIASFITQYTSWKWVFSVNHPGRRRGRRRLLRHATAPVSAGAADPGPVDHSKTSVDWIDGLLVTVGLLALLLALTEGNIVGWATLWIPMLIVVLIVIVTSFVFW
ncbi:hypothetical protein ColLi_12473 [Colletotrichum liriopes]|uniref:Uncharacterized protein n=1 Tax=Colletotrichum liriopes TaxID=708192 RepID=A0AA37LXX8_9PEZI|nr:hypothetical protein ColLi_12473 [Colletotrichum liriopes]